MHEFFDSKKSENLKIKTVVCRFQFAKSQKEKKWEKERKRQKNKKKERKSQAFSNVCMNFLYIKPNIGQIEKKSNFWNNKCKTNIILSQY